MPNVIIVLSNIGILQYHKEVTNIANSIVIFISNRYFGPITNSRYAFHFHISISEFKEAKEIIAENKKLEARKTREKSYLDGSFNDYCLQHIMVTVRIRVYAKINR